MAKRWILALNAGSSSLKFAAYDLSLNKIASGQVAGIDVDGHGAALHKALALVKGPPAIIGHRIVHGASRTAPAVLSPELHLEIEHVAKLAPLHNPPALRVIDALQAQFPDLPQVLCFDTAFHSDNPAEATVIPIPQELRDMGIRRYGFHGLSYASVVRRFEGMTGTSLPRRLLAFHLGAGASLAAIVDGKGVATTMGFSPMDGLVMATRAGAMDAGVVLHLMEATGMEAAQIHHMLNNKSGLLALAGNSDMKSVLADQSDAARFAVSHYCYWVARHAGAMVAAMQGVDGFVFTGGVGENAEPVRKAIMSKLDWLGAPTQNVWIVPADEEAEIVRSAAGFLSCAGF